MLNRFSYVTYLPTLSPLWLDNCPFLNCPFLIWIIAHFWIEFVLLLLSFKCSFYIRHTKPVSSKVFQYFLPVCGSYFYPFIRVFNRAEVFILIKSNPWIFLSWILLLAMFKKTHHQIQGHVDFLLPFLLKVLYFCLLNLSLWSISSSCLHTA